MPCSIQLTWQLDAQNVIHAVQAHHATMYPTTTVVVSHCLQSLSVLLSTHAEHSSSQRLPRPRCRWTRTTAKPTEDMGISTGSTLERPTNTDLCEYSCCNTHENPGYDHGRPVGPTSIRVPPALYETRAKQDTPALTMYKPHLAFRLITLDTTERSKKEKYNDQRCDLTTSGGSLREHCLEQVQTVIISAPYRPRNSSSQKSQRVKSSESFPLSQPERGDEVSSSFPGSACKE